MKKIIKKCTHQDCNLKTYNHQNKCILHCYKNGWTTEPKAVYENIDYNIFWNELRKFIDYFHTNNGNDILIFEGIVFPEFTKYNKPLTSNIDEPLTNDYYFWKKGETRSFKKMAHFKNCIFYNFDFNLMKCESLILDNIEVKGTLSISNCDIEYLSINIKVIETLKIETLKNLELNIYNSNINCSIFNNISLKSIKFLNSTFNKIKLTNLVIEKGIFENINFNYIEKYSNIKIEDINKFQYLSVYTKKTNDREYFRFFKNYFFDKRDYIEANKMYKREMDTYLKITFNELMKPQNIFENFQNLIILGFGKISSNFGQSWFHSLILIIIVLFFNIYYTSKLKLSYLFSGYANLWDKMAQLFYIKDIENFGMIDLLFKVLIALLVYQLTITLKRKTRF